MGFYLRKGFNLGPLRLNLSKSGVGFSVGVKGARVGVDPRGRAYVHAGRGGFYFRETLNPPAQPDRQPSRVIPEAIPIRDFESGESWSLTDESQTPLVAELTRVYRRISRVGIVASIAALLVAAGLVVAVGEVLPLNPVAWGLVAVSAAVVLGFAFKKAREADERHGNVNLTFDLDPEAERRFTALCDALQAFAACERVWQVQTEQRTSDWKRNAGATSLISRNLVQPSSALPKGVKSTRAITCLPAGRQTLYFFPNAMLVYDSSGVGAVSYSRLLSKTWMVSFTEEEGAPSDGQVIRHTWRYVNKSGGPDRRFNNNSELPVMRYGALGLTSETGLNELFYTSNPEAVEPLREALAALRGLTVEWRRTATEVREAS